MTNRLSSLDLSQVGTLLRGEPRFLRAWSEGDQLRMSVRDDGPGRVEANPPGQAIEFAPTRARLEELYGPKGRLTLPEDATKGWNVELNFPLRHPIFDGAVASA